MGTTNPGTRCCSTPSLIGTTWTCGAAPSVAASASSISTLSAVVSPPGTGQPWASYALSVCQWDGTTASNCMAPAPTCVAATQAGNANVNIPTNCTVGGLAPGQQYRVTAQATKTGQSSVTSAPSFAYTPWT